MSSNAADTLVTEALASPWAITQPGLSTVMAVLTRTSVPPEALERDRGTPLTNDGNAEVTIRDGVAIIQASGPLVRRGDFFSRVSGATSYDRIARDLGYALDASNARAILISIDSPGGTVTGVSDLAAMIRVGRDRKPIVVHTDGSLASAAYWLAAGATEIVASPTALIGSIGIVMAMRKDRGSPTDRMATFEFVSSQSPKKRVDPETDAGRAQILGTVDAMAQVFVETVARYRGVTPATVLAQFGQGDVLVGQKALAVGMIDRLGTFEETLARLAGRSAPAPTPARVARPAVAASHAAATVTPATTAPSAAAVRQERAERLRAAQARTGTLREPESATQVDAGAKATPARSAGVRRPVPVTTTPVAPVDRQQRADRLRAAQSRTGHRRESSAADHSVQAPSAQFRTTAPQVSPTDSGSGLAGIVTQVTPAERLVRRKRLVAAAKRQGLL